VQEELEKTARGILGQRIRMTASGRTDKGVHAVEQAVSFQTDAAITPSRLLIAFNAILPNDISVAKIRKVPVDFNARYRAKKKLYEYRIWNRPSLSVWARRYSWHVFPALDVASMRMAAKLLQGRHDFSAFAAARGEQDNKIVDLKKITILKKGGLVILRFEADRFLYKMVRNMTGTIVDIGKGRIAPDAIRSVLKSGDRRRAGPTAPPQGLFLKKVMF
jgi:tRNA pseudouridine38-40 synthase